MASATAAIPPCSSGCGTAKSSKAGSIAAWACCAIAADADLGDAARLLGADLSIDGMEAPFVCGSGELISDWHAERW